MEDIRTIDEIKKAIDKIGKNSSLTYGYREDVIAVLEWVLKGNDFDRLVEENKSET